MYLFYRDGCEPFGGPCHRCGGPFETEAAVLAGDAVHDELRKGAGMEPRE